MPEEIIGGIGVTVGGSLSELEAVLAKAESMVASSAKRVAPIAANYFSPGGAAAANNSSRSSTPAGGAASTRQPDMASFTRALGDATTRLTALVAALTSASSSVRSASSTAGGGEGTVKALRRKNLRDRGVGTEVNPSTIYTYEPESEQEAQRQAAASSRERSLAARDVERSRRSANERLLRGVGARLGGKTPYSQYDYERAYAPGPGPSGGIDTWRAPQARLAESNRPKPASVERTAEMIAAGAIQREREARRTPPQGTRYTLPESRAALSGGAGPGSSYRPKSDEEIDRIVQNRLVLREAQTVSAGRTPRTGASTLGGFYIGGGQQRIADENALSSAIQKRNVAERSVVVAEDRLRDPRVFSDIVAKRHATEELSVAQNKLTLSVSEEDRARKKVASYSGLAAGLRNLTGAALGGAAFGLGLEAIGVATKAAERAAAPYFGAMTGWAQNTADLTNSLADQARQAQGNAKGVTSLMLAQQGFAQASADSLSPIVAQRAQTEAGNKALVDQIQTMRDAQNILGQRPNAGLVGGGTGGVLGTGIFGTPSTGELTGNYLQSLSKLPQGTYATPDEQSASRHISPQAFENMFPDAASAAASKVLSQTETGIAYVNDQLKKGGDAAAAFQVALSKTDPAIEKTAIAFEQAGSPEMAKGIRQLGLIAPGISSAADAITALRSINLAGTQIGPQEQLAQQQIAAQNAANSIPALRAEMQRELPATMNAIERQFQRTTEIQQPAQAALSFFAAPPVAPGVGIPVASAQDAALVKSSVEGTAAAQKQLDTYYESGYAVLRDTYGVSQSLLDSLSSTGRSIQSVQTGMASRDATQQAAQYNYQLTVAKQQMGDISGLAGVNLGYGQTQIGQLERQNLLLSRQSQELGFQMQQRQINFSIAQAGFQVPGQTAAQQAANVKEAQIEASFQQRQLTYSKAQFGNQVKIVDLSNLRSAQNMARDIGLMISGHRVSLLDTADQQRLARLNAQQQITANKINAQMSKVESKANVLIGYWQQLEAAAGKTIASTEVAWVAAAYNIGAAWYQGATGSGLKNVPGGDTMGGTSSGLHASGVIGNTSGPTRMTVGEAGMETVAVLRNPRSVDVGSMGGGGGTTVIDVHDNHLGSEADMNTLVRKIVVALGKDAALRGMRSPN